MSNYYLTGPDGKNIKACRSCWRERDRERKRNEGRVPKLVVKPSSPLHDGGS